MLSNKKYFISQINSSKAYQFTCQYHYSHQGFKKASVNLGVFNKETQEMVGVLQWGCSAQDGIRLDRYVKEPIKKEEYLELNRFCMADSEGANSESQAISLGIKWLKQNRPDIRLLVSYAGRKEGNYGYIYQATNWEYLGYFISPGFWMIDGEEKHQLTVWYHYDKHGDKSLPMIPALCKMYHSVIQTWTKQFIYIQRLDKTLTPASPLLEYPKPTNEFPIQTKVKIYQDEPYEPIEKNIKHKKFFYEEEEKLFSRRALIRQGLIKVTKYKYAAYEIDGKLIGIYSKPKEMESEGYNYAGIAKSLRENRRYKERYFIKYPEEEEIPEQIEVQPVCIYDEIPFYTMTAVVRYTGLSRQAVHQSRNSKATVLGGKEIIWLGDKNEKDI